MNAITAKAAEPAVSGYSEMMIVSSIPTVFKFNYPMASLFMGFPLKCVGVVCLSKQ